MLKQKFFSPILGLFIFLFSISSFAAADVQWLGKQTIVINRVFEMTKPSPNWDTKIQPNSDTPVGMTLHKSGYNPSILVRLDYSPRGKTLMDYAANIRSDLSLRGVQIESTVEKSINNTEAVLMSGTEPSGNNRWLVAVFRSKGVGMIVECMMWSQEYTKYVADFMKAINSIRINH